MAASILLTVFYKITTKSGNLLVIWLVSGGLVDCCWLLLVAAGGWCSYKFVRTVRTSSTVIQYYFMYYLVVL